MSRKSRKSKPPIPRTRPEKVLAAFGLAGAMSQMVVELGHEFKAQPDLTLGRIIVDCIEAGMKYERHNSKVIDAVADLDLTRAELRKIQKVQDNVLKPAEDDLGLHEPIPSDMWSEN